MSTNGWPMVPLGDIVSHRKEFIQICETEQYKRCRVQLGARGIVLRDQIMGCDIKTKKQQVCHSGELLVAEIDAKVGGFGIVPELLEGAIVSSHYFLYTINNGRINKSFLAYYIKTPAFQEQINAQGSTNYSAIRSHQVLEYEIPLPDRKEQDRIVAKLDALSARIDEARELLVQSQVETLSLITSLHHSLAGSRVVKVSDLLCLEEDREPVTAIGEYPQVGIKSFGGGLFAKEPVLGLDTTYKYFNRLSSGMVVLSQVKGWEGAVAVCPDDLEGRFASPEYRTFRCLDGAALPEYLASLVKTEWFHGLLAMATRGQGARRERTRPEMFLDIELPMPGIDKQARAVEVFRRLWDVTPNNEIMITQLDAMLPSILDKAFKGEL